MPLRVEGGAALDTVGYVSCALVAGRVGYTAELECGCCGWWEGGITLCVDDKEMGERADV